MSEAIKHNIENYKTAPFDSRFPNQNQTRGCWQNYLDFHRCEKTMNAKCLDPYVCQWYKKVYLSLCPSFGLTAGMKVGKVAVFQAKSDGLFVCQSLPSSGSCAAESFPCGTSEGLSEMALVCLSA